MESRSRLSWPRERREAIFSIWSEGEERENRSLEASVNSRTNGKEIEAGFVGERQERTQWLTAPSSDGVRINDGEFDPGSERTLAARLKHASRANRFLRGAGSGGRVSNTWMTCPAVWNSLWKHGVMPDETACVVAGRERP